jgi:hypothetical protein
MPVLETIATVAAGVKLVDQFYDVVMKWTGLNKKPGQTIEKVGVELIVKSGKYSSALTSAPPPATFSKTDQTRHDALMSRIESNWTLFNKHYASLPKLSADEKNRIELVMEDLKKELCKDFKELVRLYEKVLQTSFPDHYSLYEICA